MFGKNKRFIVKHKEEQGFSSIRIWVDRETGVNYLLMTYGNGGGLTPLLDKNGQVVRDDPRNLQYDD